MSRARSARRPKLGELASTARARYARSSARKVRFVADLIRGLTVREAALQLKFTHRPSGSPILAKLLKSAVSNAYPGATPPDESGDLIVGQVFADGGPILKRFRAAPMGRGVSIRKRTAHVTIKLYRQPEGA